MRDSSLSLYSNRNKIYFIRKNLKGIVKLVAFGTTFFTRALYYLKFDKERRSKLVQALRDGFNIPV